MTRSVRSPATTAVLRIPVVPDRNFNGAFSQSGENATLTNASYNGNIAPGGSVSVGFQGTWTSNDTSPTSFALNGASCS